MVPKEAAHLLSILLASDNTNLVNCVRVARVAHSVGLQQRKNGIRNSIGGRRLVDSFAPEFFAF
jgi:hypothetical protein